MEAGRLILMPLGYTQPLVPGPPRGPVSLYPLIRAPTHRNSSPEWIPALQHHQVQILDCGDQVTTKGQVCKSNGDVKALGGKPEVAKGDGKWLTLHNYQSLDLLVGVPFLTSQRSWSSRRVPPPSPGPSGGTGKDVKIPPGAFCFVSAWLASWTLCPLHKAPAFLACLSKF